MSLLTKTALKAASYPKFRPAPPPELIKKIVGFLNERLSTPFDTAVDVGCGNGKSTEALSPYFKNVIGFDSSDLKDIYAHRPGGLSYNIIYRQGTAEGIGCLDDSVQLVTAAQCAHWFNLKKFYSEVERVLAPGGVLAIYGYSLPSCEKPYDQINGIIDELMNKKLAEFMPHQSKNLYVHKYQTKDFDDFTFNKEPLKRDEDSYLKVKGSISDLVNYIRSTATFQNYENTYGQSAGNKILHQLEDDLIQAAGSENAQKSDLSIIFNFVMVMGRKPF
ncbi:putative methyltransferase DDB_G0268948 [Planococcus citri]|uniref:putative methyltransferase DDB_G0268948 n=1 Tax=Planococcus citri TaxID=170843 RepID=UPI0031F90815